MPDKAGPSADLLRLGEEIASKRKMGLLAPDQRLPFGYFNPVRETGRIDVPGHERVAARSETDFSRPKR